MVAKKRIYIGVVIGLVAVVSCFYRVRDVETSTLAIDSPGASSVNKSDGSVDYLRRLSAATVEQGADNALFSYQPIPGVEGRNRLDEIYAAGVPATVAAVRRTRSLLKNAGAQEKISLIRILAKQFNPENTSSLNDEIILDLRDLAQSSDRDVAKSAVIAFAGLGYLPGSERVLVDARKVGLLSDHEYFGELAHLALTASDEPQARLFEEIKLSGNDYASDIFSFALKNRLDLIQIMAPQAKADLIEFLASTEPRFPKEVAEFGFTDLIRYNNWLRTSVQLSKGGAPADADPYMVEYLGQANTDPRAVVAYLSSSEGRSLIGAAPKGSPVQSLVLAANRYAKQFPSNQLLSELVMTFNEPATR